jgi:hypothetical protein
LLLLALGFIGLLLRSQWPEIQAQSWRLDIGWLAAAVVLILFTWGVEIAIWRHLLTMLDGPLTNRMDFWASARIWFLSAIVRYIPGNVWQPLGMTVLCSRRGIRAEATLLSALLIQAVTMLGALPLVALYLLATGNLGMLTGTLGQMAPWLAGSAMGAVGIFLLRPHWLFNGMNWLLTKAGRTALPVQVSSLSLLGLILAGGLTWIGWGLTFAAVTLAVVEISFPRMLTNLFDFVAAYPMAYIIGYLSFLTPSGLGIREGALYFWLEPVIGGGVATVAALAMRLFTTLGEVLLAGISFLAGMGDE